MVVTRLPGQKKATFTILAAKAMRCRLQRYRQKSHLRGGRSNKSRTIDGGSRGTAILPCDRTATRVWIARDGGQADGPVDATSCSSVCAFRSSGGGIAAGLGHVRRFAGIDLGREGTPGETTACKFRHLQEKHGPADQLFTAVSEHLKQHGMQLSQGTIVDATIIAVPPLRRTRAGHATRKCTRRRSASSGTRQPLLRCLDSGIPTVSR